MKKIIFITILILGFVLIPSSYSSIYAISDNNYNVSSLRADDIRYRYKSINGILYKRLYNYSTHEWIGDWIPA